MHVEEIVIRRTHRVPVPDGPLGDGATAVRQLDAVLMSIGFKLSDDLFTQLSVLSAGTVIDTAVRVLDVVRGMVGDHVQHNVYFRDFPANVPDTTEFWAECLIEALADPAAAAQIAGDVHVLGTLNLLSLPRYGRYQHSYDEMLAAHHEFIAGASDRVTVLHAGSSLNEEVGALYNAMAAATTPGNDTDREDLAALALACVADTAQPQQIPVRENRALINSVRLSVRADLLVNTVTDVLRLACAVSGGDVTLVHPSRFGGFGRPVRRALLASLHRVVRDNPDALADVHRHSEQWKRLGERLHPHEHPQWPGAAAVFAVARGEQQAPSLASKAEQLFRRGETVAAATVLQNAPGQLVRAVDRLLRSAGTPAEQAEIADIVAATARRVSGRVLLSLREHLDNRPTGPAQGRRIFVNQSGRGHAATDTRAPIPVPVMARLREVLDEEIRRRIPTGPRWVIDPEMLEVALPVSGKAVAAGFGTLPRGSVSPVDGQLLRFFVYWRQADQRTDFDLSALMLDRTYRNPTWLSYTHLSSLGGRHSGDITEAPNGASEFIDIDLTEIPADIVIPQVNIFSGEGFNEVAESFFGFMCRNPEQEGQPYEPRTVRMKSDLRGTGRVALPIAFLRGDDGRWRATWLHLHVAGRFETNQVENNRATTTDLVRATFQRRPLTLGYLAALRGATIGRPEGPEPVTYIGFEQPGDLPDRSVVITPANLGELLPA
ncbi:TerD family protein [Nocardia sp. NPDC050710]|uniref:TerD family protein n=1 Tax=Nocardia sp. NPDC050710 TaxID=3157220 RepID=UPI0033C9E359